MQPALSILCYCSNQMSRNVILAVVSLALGATSVYGQATGRLTGSVTGPSGAAVPDAIVDLLLKDGDKPLLSTTTTSEGLFSMTGVRTGAYKIAVTATSFALDRKSTRLNSSHFGI